MNRNNTIINTFILMICIQGIMLWISGERIIGQEEQKIAQELVFPQQLQEEIQLLKTIKFPDQPTLEDVWRKEIVKNLYGWFDETMRSFSGIHAVNVYQKIFPTTLYTKPLDWKQRFALLNNPGDQLLAIHIVSWISGHRELFVCQIDYPSYALRDSVYFQSTPPRLYLKIGPASGMTDLATWKYFDRGSLIYTIHGLVPASDVETFPDVLLSTGPDGSENVVYFIQMHYDEHTQSWQMVWHIDFPQAIAVVYSGETRVLTVTYNWTGEPEKSSYQLQWGERAKESSK